MANRIVIIGAGGHGKVVCDAILAQNKYEIIGFADVAVPVGTAIINGYKVIAAQNEIELLKEKAEYFIIAIGNNRIREQAFFFAKKKLQPAVIIHPSAVIGSEVIIGGGAVILANALVNAFSSIGENTIVNAGAVIDHDCVIGAHAHLSIGTVTGSNSMIGDYYTSSIGERMAAFSKIH